MSRTLLFCSFFTSEIPPEEWDPRSRKIGARPPVNATPKMQRVDFAQEEEDEENDDAIEEYTVEWARVEKDDEMSKIMEKDVTRGAIHKNFQRVK